MFILFLKSQLPLFDMPIRVEGTVRKDGTVVKPHIRIQKVAVKPHQADMFAPAQATPEPKQKRTKLDAFIDKHGGVAGLGRTLSAMTEGQQQRIFEEMARVGGKTPAEVASMFAEAIQKPAEPEKGETLDLFAVPHEEPGRAEQASDKAVDHPEHGLEMVEHVTGKGKTIRGVVRTDLTQAQAKDIDPYTFRKNGGWFIREKHLDYVPESAASVSAEPAKKTKAKRAKPEAATAASIAHDPAAPFGVAAGTSKGKRRDINAAVVSRLTEGGPYSPDDLEQFRQYSGNGGCGDSLNEFYTDPRVAASMWSALRTLGFEHGTAMEPSCATGVFLHTAPAGVRVTGVELDPVSAQVAQALHGDRHEIITASLERFATTDDRQFDVVIGNPPYGPRGFLAKDDKVDISTAEQYFTDTALDKCKPGGLVALVVPTGIMDSKSARSFRERLLRKGQFLGAMRMPNTAFEHSHTEVTTDVVFFRKRPDDVAGALGVVDQDTLKRLGVWDDDFLSGSYFTGRGSENILGSQEAGWRAKAGMGNDITVEGSMDGVPEAIAAFHPDPESADIKDLTVNTILDALGDDETAKDRAVSAAARRPYANMAKVGDTKTVDGVQYVLQGDPPRWHRVDEFMETDSISEARRLSVEIDALMSGSRAVDRQALEAGVREYVKRFGVPVNDPEVMTAASVDKNLFRLVGAVDRNGELSDLVLGKVAKVQEGGFDATAQTLALEHESGGFTSAELAERLGRETGEVVDQLAADPRYAYLGAGQWTTMDAYLTGELWPKLDAARAAVEAGAEPDLIEKRKLQIDRLEKVIDQKSLDDVDFQMNSAFVPTEILSAFFNWKQYESPEANKWTKEQKPVEITFEDSVYSITGGNQYGYLKIVDKYLNRSGVRKEDDLPQIEQLNAEFKEWLCASNYRDSVEDAYNRAFRGFVAPTYSDAPIDVPGLNPDKTVRNWRWSSLRRSLADGKGIIADDVGLGKTLGGLLLARMAKTQGKSKRPLIVVPKAVLANWYEEANAWFPGCSILTIGSSFSKGKNGELVGKDDSPAERKRKYHDMQQNDYDFIVISEPAFEELDLDPATKEEYYSQDFWVQRGEKLGNAGDKRRKAIKERYEQHIAQREFSDHTDAVYFNELGVDMLIADEMHHQKNLYAARARFGGQPKFLGGQALSNRALDFNLKARWIRETNDGKNVYGLTATPTKNSPLEIYSMLSHIAPEAFEKIKVRNSEEFLDRFCEFVSDKVLSTKGDIEDAIVVNGFKNMDELREIMSRYIDRRTADDVGLVLPKRNDKLHLVDMSPAQQAVYAELRELAKESAGKKDATGDAHAFSIMSKMNMAALDLSLLDPEQYAKSVNPKYAELAKQCKSGAKEGGQIVFSEYVDSHEKIVAALVDAGFKRDEIGVINAQVASSSVKRQNIANAFNDGKLKVVVGNVTMAEGLNMQKTTTDIHHLDVPWEPATLQQRNGRGLRQGNLNEAIRIHTYLSKGSFDGYRYQSVSAKKDWQDLIWGGGDRVENLAREGKFSKEEIRIMLAADPEAARAEYEKDKSAAQQRYDTGKRQEAQSEFVRFVEMSNSFRSLKNKDTVSARRLRQKIEGIKTSLFNNKYWPAKQALDSATDVLIHPQTGAVLTKDVGLDFAQDGKMVVTGVNMKAGTVTLRRYADTAGARHVTLPMSEISDGKPYKFDAAEEATEVGKAMEAAATEKLNSLKSWDDIKNMPSAVLEANHDLIQRQIKEGTKAYKFDMPYGSVPMVNRETGDLKMAESYEHPKLHDTHDYLLPTDAAKDKVLRAWIDARKAARYDTDYVKRTRGAGSRSGVSDQKPIRYYKDAHFSSKGRNPFFGLLKEMHGEAGKAKAKAMLHREQLVAIRHASDVSGVFDGLMPTGDLSSGTVVHGAIDRTVGKVAYPKEPLMMAWARLRHLGQLGSPITGQSHSSYAYGGTTKTSAQAALVRMAVMSGHSDLVDAFIQSASRDGSLSDDELFKYAGTRSNSLVAMRAFKREAEKRGISDKTISDVRSIGLDGPFAARSGYAWERTGTMDSHNGHKIGEVADELINRLNKEAAA